MTLFSGLGVSSDMAAPSRWPGCVYPPPVQPDSGPPALPNCAKHSVRHPDVFTKTRADSPPRGRPEPFNCFKIFDMLKVGEEEESGSRSAYGFCQGDRGDMGRSRIPIARSRRRKACP